MASSLFVSPMAIEPGRLPSSRSQARDTGVAAGGGPDMDWNVQMSTEPQRQCSPRWGN